MALNKKIISLLFSYLYYIPRNERAKLIAVTPRINGTSSNTQNAIANECATYNLNIKFYEEEKIIFFNFTGFDKKYMIHHYHKHWHYDPRKKMDRFLRFHLLMTYPTPKAECNSKKM